MIQQYKDILVLLSDESLSLSEKLDNLSWNVSKKEEDLTQIVSHIKTLNDQYLQEKNQVGNILTSACDELDTTERQITYIKTQISSVTSATSLSMKKAKLEYVPNYLFGINQLFFSHSMFRIETRSQQLASDREDVLRQVVKALSTVFGFEQQVSLKLDEFDRYIGSYQKEIQDNLLEEGILIDALH